MRAELVPSANVIGREMGQAMSRGISENLGVTKVSIDKMKRSITDGLKGIKVEIGLDVTKVAIDALRKKIGVGLDKIKVNVEVDVTKANLDATRIKIHDGLSGIKVNVEVGASAVDIANTRRKIRDGLKGIKVTVGTSGGIAGLIPGGRGGGAAGAAAAGGSGFIGGIGALIRALPGGTSGSIAAVPAPVAISAGAITAGILPFLAQAIAGFVPLALGSGIAGLGIAGAVGAGGTTQQQVAQARAQAQTANARVRAAQARLSGLQAGGAGPTGLAVTAAQDRLAAAQARLSGLRGSGTASSASILSAQAAVLSAQDRLNKLRTTGKASTAQLAGAEASLASARATQAKASQAYQKAQKDQITAGQESVRNSFKRLAEDAKQSLGTIGESFVPVMQGILSTADRVLKKLTPVFSAAVRLIGGPFEQFVETFLTAFTSPQVESSITAVATAFSDILKAFTPDIPGIVKSFADAIERIAHAVSDNPKAFADFLNFMFQVVIFAVNVIAALTRVATWIEEHWGPIWRSVQRAVIQALGPIAGFVVNHIIPIIRAIITAAIWVKDNWSKIWADIKKATTDVWNAIRKIFASFIVDGILGPLGTILHAAAVAFGWIPKIGGPLKTADKQFQDFKDSVNKSLGGINDQTVNVGVRMTAKTNPYPGGISGRAQRGLYISRGTWGADDQIIAAQRGELVVPTNMVSAGWVDHLRGYIPGFAGGGVAGGVSVAAHFPPHTDMSKMIKWNVVHLAEQFAQASIKAMVAIGGQRVANIGSGVQRWSGTVLQALAMLGMSPALLPRILYQMQTESGGNPNAINNWDINAQRGDPSRGLMQTIGSTFRAYHVLGTSSNIYDPLANIAAAINYARHVYGPTLGALGSGHGYAIGTGGAAAGWAWVGENGPELVHFKGGEVVVPTGGLGGYASGTSVATLQAMIARYRATIDIERRRMANYPGAAGAAERRLLASQIAVNQAHINDLNRRIYTVEHTVPALNSAVTKMANAGATVAANVAKITPATTTASLDASQRLFLKDLRLYFSPSTANARSRLVISQISQMKSLEAQIKRSADNVKAATDFQKQTLTRLQQGSGLGAIGIQGQGAAQGTSLLTGLNRQITDLRNFGNALKGLRAAGASQSLLQRVAGMAPDVGSVYGNKMITLLRKLKGLKVPAAMVNQLVALGPDAGIAYADALIHADKRTLANIIKAESTLSATQLAVSRGAASVAYGGAYVTGANFVAGLQSQQKHLESIFAHLGKTLGQEAIKWFRVPPKQRPYGYQHGGWINEPISGFGLYSGAAYTFAEAGPEYVVEHGAAMTRARGGDGAEYHAHFDGLTGAAIESHVQTAFQAMSMQQGRLQRQGRRS